MKVPDRFISHSMEEALDYHLNVHEEIDGNKIRLSPLARKMLVTSLENLEKTMRRFGHTHDAIQDCITNVIWAFCNGYELGLLGR